jgi:hypothetical protein
MSSAVNRPDAIQPDVCLAFRGVGWAGFQHMKAVGRWSSEPSR